MLEKLEYIIALAREKNFARAAESCGVTQPTLSQGIQKLEEALKTRLVQRSSRFQGFTAEGERVLIWARRIVGDTHAMRQEIFGLHNGVGSHLRIAAVPPAMPAVASLTVPYQERYPTVRFTVLSRTSDVLIQLLHQREIDVGITYLDNEPIAEVTSVPLYREEYFLLTSRQGAYGHSDQVTWAQTGTLPLCLMTRDLQHRRIIDAVMKVAGHEMVPMVETDSVFGLISHVQTGRWVSIIPRSMLDQVKISKSLCAVAIVEPEISHTVGLVVSDRYPISPAVNSLMKMARLVATPELAKIA
jgi:DNA-binding transcriptional LysR family regulator